MTRFPEGHDPDPARGSHSGCRARESSAVPPRPGADRAPTDRIPPRPRNYSWSELMRRVFLVDVLDCPECHGRMRIVAALRSPEAIRAILECLGLPSRAPPVAPATPEAEVDRVDPDLEGDLGLDPDPS